MGFPFTDITLYTPTPYPNNSQEYWEEISLENFVCDLYVRKMNGYKPPKTSRICIQPWYYKIWDRTWKNGSIISIAVEFVRDKFESLDRQGKCKYILDIIQQATIQLSEEYNWNKSIFEQAYQQIVDTDFIFKINYPVKASKNRKMAANLCIEKTETITSCYVMIHVAGLTSKIRLFDKQNAWCYDCIYILAKQAKWHDSDRFGIYYDSGILEISYSIKDNQVLYFEYATRVEKVDFSRFFMFELRIPNVLK